MSTKKLRDQINKSREAVMQQESDNNENKFKQSLKPAGDQRKQFPTRMEQELYEELQIIRVRTKIPVNSMLEAAARRLVDEYNETGTLDSISEYLGGK